ncbi:MAG: hypothetical protein VYE68_04670 [Acidobacteriota bacterium]|nr:hypothetical protein [Acidobacteriota bacterium]
MNPGRHRLLVTIFGAVLGFGILTELWLKTPLYADDRAIGLHPIALFIPFIGAMTFLFASCVVNRLDPRSMAGTALLFTLLCLPFADVLGRPIEHLADDSRDYSIYAHNILNEGTLSGSDDLVYSLRYYIDQPGFRYYLALAIALADGEHRSMQLLTLAVLLATTILLLNTLQPRIARAWFLVGALCGQERADGDDRVVRRAQLHAIRRVLSARTSHAGHRFSRTGPFRAAEPALGLTDPRRGPGSHNASLVAGGDLYGRPEAPALPQSLLRGRSALPRGKPRMDRWG